MAFKNTFLYKTQMLQDENLIHMKLQIKTPTESGSLNFPNAFHSTQL